MNYKYLIFLVAIIICTISCRTIQDSANEVTVNYMNDPKDASTLMDSIRVIKPASIVKEAVIGRTERVLASDDRIFIVDRMLNKVLCFDYAGNFIKSTESLIGKSKNEYVSVLDASIDPIEGLLYVYFDSPYRMMTFNMDLERVDTYQLNELFFEIAISGNSLYSLCYNANEDAMELRQYDKHHPDGEYQVLLTQDKIAQGVGWMGKALTSDGSKCWLSLPFSNKIYSINDKKIVSEYLIDFGDRWFDYSKSKDLRGSSFLNFNKDKISLIYNISASDSLLLFNTNKAGLVSAVRETNQATLNLFVENDDCPFMSSTIFPLGGLPSSMVIIVPNSQIMQYKAECKRHNTKEVFSNKQLEQIVNEYQNSDNPLIVIARIK